MNDLKTLCLNIVALPLLAAIIAGLAGRLIGRRGAHTLTTLAMGLAFIFSLQVLVRLVHQNALPLNFNVYTWGSSGSLAFHLGFLIDQLSALMMVVVTFVSLIVHFYSIGYMHEDPGYQRFFSYISLFTFGMLMLVMSNNFLQLFFGWEMVGLMSYLLIGFWFQKESAIFANLKAFIVNRVGDFGFILGIAAVFYFFGTLDYQSVFSGIPRVTSIQQSLVLTSTFSISAMTIICLCLFIGAMGKSAQIPLHVWLPDSMEGPTPISALIHAATMVTAGVFMIARLSPLFEYSEMALNVILIIGSLTCLLMGLVSIVQNDIKRIIAYSTLSQLGYMMTAMGVSAYPIGIFHLTTHAFFKALLFLGAGSVIFMMHHEQDIWKMGNLKKYMPVTYITMLIGSLALIGFPFLSGFYSKDLIIEAVKLSTLPGASFAYAIVLGSVFITALYTFRLLFVVFHGKERFSKTTITYLHEAPAVIWISLIILAIPSLISGALLVGPLFENFFGGSIVILDQHKAYEILNNEFKGSWVMAQQGLLSMPFWLAIAGILSAWLCYIKYPKVSMFFKNRFRVLNQILQNKFGFDIFYQWAFAAGARSIGRFCWIFGDQLIIDGVGVNGSARGIGRLSLIGKKFQSGFLYHYAFTMIVGFLFLVIWLIVLD